MSVETAVQKALYDAVDAALSDTVYIDVPDNAAFPYVHIEEIDAADWSTKDVIGFEFTVTINSYARASTSSAASTKVRSLNDDIRAALHQQSLTVSGYTAVIVRFLNSFVTTAADGVTRQGITRFRLLVQ